MIALAKNCQDAETVDAIHGKFLTMLPKIKSQARVAFRGLPTSEKEECITEVVANAYCTFVRLVKRGKIDLAYATPLARYAIRQVRSGRRVGTSVNVHDVSSPSFQRRHGTRTERLDQFDIRTGNWREVVVEDRRSTPADIAASRIDFAAWLESLPRRTREIALHLASGATTKEVAKHFEVSPGRISQVRAELKAKWEAFHAPDLLTVVT